MKKTMIILLALACLLVFAEPSLAHGYLCLDYGPSLPRVMGQIDLGEKAALLGSWESTSYYNGTENITDWSLYLGLKFYDSGDNLRTYKGIGIVSQSQHGVDAFSRHGLLGVYGYEWRLGDFVGIVAFAEAGLRLAAVNDVLTVEPVYGCGVGISLWIY